MPQSKQLCMTAIHFAPEFMAVAPTAQWIAAIFDCLHPTQQEQVISRIQEQAKARQDRPLIFTPAQPSPTMETA